MNIYTVSFFGHREISQPFIIEKRLEYTIKDLIKQHEYIEFLVGRDGEFDILTATIIHRIEREYAYGNSELVLVLPYRKAEYRDNRQSFLDYYDEVEICEESSSVHFKAAIKMRNQSMVNRSNLVIGCIEHCSGGAYQTWQYAKKQQCQMINIADGIKHNRP